MSIEVFRKRVGRAIRSAREAAGFRQDDVVERVGDSLTKSLVSRYECGAVLPRIERLRKILAACGVTTVPPLIEAGYRAVSQEQPMSYGQVFATENAKEFIEVWLEHGSIDAVAEALGMHRKQVHWYAQRLRRSGVQLPRAKITKRKSNKEDFGALRTFLESKLNGDDQAKETGS